MSSPPFGSAEYVLRTPLCLKQGYKPLEEFAFSPLYSNRTATAAERGNLSRDCQRGNDIIPDNKQSIFPGSAPSSPEAPGASDLFWYRWIVSPSTKQNQRLSEKCVFCHEFGLASLKVCQRPKPGEKQCLVLSRRRAQCWSASCQTFDNSLMKVSIPSTVYVTSLQR